jgi:fumarate hydratase subunit alpha
MRTIKTLDIKKAVFEACQSVQFRYSKPMEEAITRYMDQEMGVGKAILKVLLENSELANKEHIPMCQDTGMVVVILKLGQKVQLEGDYVIDMINEGVKEAYDVAYLRKSIVKDPLLERVNTQDNTPAVVHIEITNDDRCEILVSAKGFGSENMSKLAMLTPAHGLKGVEEFVLNTVLTAGPNACPPMVVGVGIGGTMDQAALLAKKALFNEVGDRNPDERYAALEVDWLEKINASGIGPQGLGGKTTAIDVFIKTAPTHIAGLPVAVNINCHMTRHAHISL